MALLRRAPHDPLKPATAGGRLTQPLGRNRHVVRGSLWFVVSMVTGAGLSFLFWIVAAKTADPVAYGVGSKLWAVVQFLNYATTMGLPVAVAKYGSMRRRPFNTLFAWALLYTASTSLLVAVAFAVLAPSFLEGASAEILQRHGVAASGALVFLLITGMAFSVLVEVRLVTLRLWRWVYARVLLVSLIRLPLLLVPALGGSPLGLLLLIGGTPALSGFIGVVVLRRAAAPEDRGPLRPLPPEWWVAFKFSVVNYIGMLLAQAPQFCIPILVDVGPTEFGPFFFAWQISTMLFLVPHIIGQVVLSESSHDVTHIDQQVRAGRRLSVALMAGATALIVVTAPVLIPRFLGPDYQLTADLLPVLSAASIPWAFTAIYLARARVEADHVRTASITLGFAILTLVPTALLSRRTGPVGASQAWFVGNVAAAAFAAAVTRWVRPGIGRARVTGAPEGLAGVPLSG
jgi:O-antigen/teichoic acid export membrane protein